jgi:hypothetical protein
MAGSEPTPSLTSSVFATWLVRLDVPDVQVETFTLRVRRVGPLFEGPSSCISPLKDYRLAFI